MRELKRKTEENPRTRRASTIFFNGYLPEAIITTFIQLSVKIMHKKHSY